MSTAGWRERALVPVLVLVGLVMAVVSSLGAPLIPTIARADHVSISTAQWMLTATLLAGAVASPIMGQLGDGRSRSPLIRWALGAVLLGSLLIAVFDGLLPLLVGRTLQGFGLGLIPTAMIVARHHLAPDRAARVIAVLSVTAGVGIGLGYPLTGLLAENGNYHLAFWVAAAVVAAALLAALLVLPTDHDDRPSHLDVPGAALFSVALLALLTALSQGEVWGWASARILALLALGAGTLAVWVRYELHVHRPLVVLTRLRERTVLVTDISATVLSVGMYLFLPVVVEFAQVSRSAGYGFGASAALAGLCLLPMSIGMGAMSFVVPRLMDTVGARRLVPAGQLALAFAMLLFALEHSALWTAFVSMGVAGLGIGASFGAMPGLIIGSVPHSESGSAMGLYQVLRTSGFAIGSALCAAVLAAFTTGGAVLPRVAGYRTVLTLGAALCVASAALSVLLPRDRGVPADEGMTAPEIEATALP